MTETKAELRDRMRNERKRLKAALPGAGEAAAGHAAALIRTMTFQPRSAALYLPRGGELDSLPLARELARRGLRLALPRADISGAPLAFHAWKPGDAVEADAEGCAAPLHSTETLDPDIVIVPLVAFDRCGRRLGQGGGYYDRTIEALGRRSPRPLFVGLAFAGQEAAAIPHEAHDQKLDGVLTERGYMPARKDV